MVVGGKVGCDVTRGAQSRTLVQGSGEETERSPTYAGYVRGLLDVGVLQCYPLLHFGATNNHSPLRHSADTREQRSC